MVSVPPIIVASEDLPRLLQLAAQYAGATTAAQLETELERARILPLFEIPGDVVVMNSRLEYEIVATRQRRQLHLVYPHEANSDAGRVSVLAPLGCALLGLRVGQQIEWHMPGGLRCLRLLSVTRN